MKTRYCITVRDADGEYVDETWFSDGEKALAAAKAIAAPGSLSADPGFTITLEEHTITPMWSGVKPDPQ